METQKKLIHVTIGARRTKSIEGQDFWNRPRWSFGNSFCSLGAHVQRMTIPGEHIAFIFANIILHKK